MRFLDSIRSVAAAWLFRSRMESDLDAEIRAHIESRVDDLERSGLPRAEAERRARLEFGAQQRFREECREAAGTQVLDRLRQDVRFGFRTLRQSPGFTAVAILTVALGIGANTAIFSIVYAAILRPLPYADAGRLITLAEVRSQEDVVSTALNPFWEASYPDYLDWKQQATAFQSIAGGTGDGFTLRGLGEPEPIAAAQVTANFFPTLGVKPILGRNFTTAEEIPTGPAVVIVTNAFWKTRLNSDPNAVGRAIQLDRNTATIVGVLPANFAFAPQGGAEIWVPLHISPALAARRNLRWISVIGRLAPGATSAQARSEMELINQRLAAAYPAQNASVHVMMVPLRDRIVGRVESLLLILFGAAGFVLLIACANVANLLMARASRRKREFAIRSALGAGRGRLIWQLLTESLMLASVGGALGLALAHWGTRVLVAAIPATILQSMPFLRETNSDPIVLTFLAAAIILTGIAFGAAPAFELSHQGDATALKEETRTSSGGARGRVRDALVVAEIAFSLVLLVGAGLMLQSLVLLLSHDPGFNARNLLTFSINLPQTSYPKPQDVQRFNEQFTNRLLAVQGITGTSITSAIPLSGNGGTTRFVIEGQPSDPGHDRESKSRVASVNYFSILGVPLVGGRFFDKLDDSASSPMHLIVNRAWALQHLGGENPVGKRIRFTFRQDQPYREIVGMVADTADSGLDDGNDPLMFIPFLQSSGNFITYIARTSGSPADMIGPVRTALRQEDPQLLLIQPKTMDQIITQSPSVFLRRYPSLLIGTFAGLALILAVVGLYGLVSYSVMQRTREVGIRIALGAQRRDVMRLVLRDGLRLTLIGVGLGLAAAFGLTRLIRSLLFGINAADPYTFVAVAVLLSIVALVACCIPALRAMRTDPVIALRYE